MGQTLKSENLSEKFISSLLVTPTNQRFRRTTWQDCANQRLCDAEWHCSLERSSFTEFLTAELFNPVVIPLVVHKKAWPMLAGVQKEYKRNGTYPCELAKLSLP